MQQRFEFNDRQIIVVIGNKSDKEDERAIKKDEGEKLAKNCCGGIKFYETSCQTGENVEKAINDLVNDVYNKYSGNIPEDKDNILIIEKDRKRQGNGRKRFC